MSLPEPRVSPRATSRAPDYKVLAGRRPRPSSNQIPQVIEACPVGRGIDFNNGPSRPLINPPLSLLNPTPTSHPEGRGIDFNNGPSRPLINPPLSLLNPTPTSQLGRGIDFNNGPPRPLINPPLSLLNPTPRSQLGRGIDFTNLTVGVTVGVRLHY